MDEKQKVEIKDFLIDNFPKGIQAFTTRNCVGDNMKNIYSKNGIDIDICYEENYIEIFGITEEFYNELIEECYIYLFK